jgi:hypothetical protein
LRFFSVLLNRLPGRPPQRQNNCHPSRPRYVRRHAATSFMAAKR